MLTRLVFDHLGSASVATTGGGALASSPMCDDGRRRTHDGWRCASWWAYAIRPYATRRVVQRCIALRAATEEPPHIYL